MQVKNFSVEVMSHVDGLPGPGENSGTHMQIFLSWSGLRSREVASALRDWLPLVVQAANPFLSVGDIEKGRRWSDVLADELGTSVYGIICVTPYNFKSP